MPRSAPRPMASQGEPRVLRLTGAPGPATSGGGTGRPPPSSPGLPATGERIPFAPLPDGPAVTPGNLGPTQEYQAAWRLRQRQRYEEAARAFSLFVRKHPNHDLASSASLWLADTLLIQKKAAEAAWVLRAMLRRHPRGSNAPAALIKLSECEERLGRRPEAILALSRVVSQHPKSPEAAEANRRLKRLR